MDDLDLVVIAVSHLVLQAMFIERHERVRIFVTAERLAEVGWE